MSYKKVLKKLREYEPKELIRLHLHAPDGCCAVGALLSRCEQPVQKHLMSRLTEYECSYEEVQRLMAVNDRQPAHGYESAAQRYARVIKWLEEQVAKEGGT